jgi:hypothetical protein
VAEFISATRFFYSRRGGIFLPFIVEKAQRSGFFDSLWAAAIFCCSPLNWLSLLYTSLRVITTMI